MDKVEFKPRSSIRVEYTDFEGVPHAYNLTIYKVVHLNTEYGASQVVHACAMDHGIKLEFEVLEEVNNVSARG